MPEKTRYNITVAGMGYVGLSLAVLLAQHHHVKAVDTDPEKVALLRRRRSPVSDAGIDAYLHEKPLDLTAARTKAARS